MAWQNSLVTFGILECEGCRTPCSCVRQPVLLLVLSPNCMYRYVCCSLQWLAPLLGFVDMVLHSCIEVCWLYVPHLHLFWGMYGCFYHFRALFTWCCFCCSQVAMPCAAVLFVSLTMFITMLQMCCISSLCTSQVCSCSSVHVLALKPEIDCKWFTSVTAGQLGK